jgi:hypothetical protein
MDMETSAEQMDDDVRMHLTLMMADARELMEGKTRQNSMSTS